MREINHLSLHQWLRSAIPDSQQPTSPIGFLFLKLLPPPCAVLLVYGIFLPIDELHHFSRWLKHVPSCGTGGFNILCNHIWDDFPQWRIWRILFVCRTTNQVSLYSNGCWFFTRSILQYSEWFHGGFWLVGGLPRLGMVRKWCDEFLWATSQGWRNNKQPEFGEHETSLDHVTQSRASVWVSPKGDPVAK